MHSSIFSSEVASIETPDLEVSAAQPSREQPRLLTHTPVRGLERRIPLLPWRRTLTAAGLITLLLMVPWEIEMRHLGLEAGDLDDGRGYWTVERRRVDSAPRDSVVIVGDSRILFDTDLATWKKLTGALPIQLGLMGTNAQLIVHNLAEDTHFAGLLVLGTAEFSYFGDDGNALPVLNYLKSESPSQKSGHEIYKILSRYFAFLDSHYTLFTLMEQHNWPERKDVDGPYMDVWKISESYEHRQSYSWDRLERDEYLRKHAQAVWMELFAGPPVTRDDVNRAIAKSKADIDLIRARGGEVVWIRPPSSGSILDIERVRYPRQQVWDRLVRETASFGIYFEDYPSMKNLKCPDWSHLSKAAAIQFTDAYVRVLREHVEWLKANDHSVEAEQRRNASPSHGLSNKNLSLPDIVMVKSYLFP
jgi:hypothetical protein